MEEQVDRLVKKTWGGHQSESTLHCVARPDDHRR